jgi:HicB family
MPSSTGTAAALGVRRSIARVHARIAQIRLDCGRRESGHVVVVVFPRRRHPGANDMNGRIQIVGRLPVELNRRVRAAAKRRKVSLNAFLIDALTQVLGARRVAAPKGER